ncbi:MAG: pilus assembly protein TadG-related protein [Actinomycetota bacterium]|jgi:Flp pilus assembly protein TadG
MIRSRRVEGRLLSDENGLLGKGLVVGLLILALLVVAAIDGGAIVVTKTSLSNTAQQTAFDGANTYKTTGDVQQAEQAASQTAKAGGARLVSMNVNKQTGDVTVTLAKKAPTVVIQRFSYTKKWGELRETDTSAPPP